MMWCWEMIFQTWTILRGVHPIAIVHWANATLYKYVTPHLSDQCLFSFSSNFLSVILYTKSHSAFQTVRQSSLQHFSVFTSLAAFQPSCVHSFLFVFDLPDNLWNAESEFVIGDRNKISVWVQKTQIEAFLCKKLFDKF